jgi:hypothetical protein
MLRLVIVGVRDKKLKWLVTGACALLGCAGGESAELASAALENESELLAQTACQDTTGPLIDAGGRVSPSSTVDAGALMPNEDAGGLTIKSVELLGSGCGPDSGTITISADHTTFGVKLNEFSIEGGGDPILLGKHCGIFVGVRVPEGHELTLEKFAGQARTSLPEGTTLQITRSFGFTGTRGWSVEKETSVVGPSDQAVHFVDEFAESEKAFSICSPSVTLRIRVRASLDLDAPTGATASVTDLGDFQLGSRPCTNKP